jgi:hypothetical protein
MRIAPSCWSSWDSDPKSHFMTDQQLVQVPLISYFFFFSGPYKKNKRIKELRGQRKEKKERNSGTCALALVNMPDRPSFFLFFFVVDGRSGCEHARSAQKLEARKGNDDSFSLSCSIQLLDI